MANNELFYRVAREALDDATTIQELVDDLDAAVESYLTMHEEEGLMPPSGEISHGYNHALAFTDNLRAWRDRQAPLASYFEEGR